MRNKVSGLLLSAILFSLPVWATTFTLQPAGGAVSGAPGSIVGWGFEITNSSDYLVLTSSNFEPSSVLGTYTDFTQFNFFVVGPAPESADITQAFDNLGMTGIGSFTISSGATAGQSAVGSIVITYDLYSVSPNDPSFDPTIDLVSTDNTLQAVASVDVASTAVPESTSLVLLVTGLAGFWVRRSRR